MPNNSHTYLSVCESLCALPGPPTYFISFFQAEVVDMGYPVAETGTVEILIHVSDVNNQLPKFSKDSYTFYIDDESDSNTTIGKVSAKDSDSNPNLIFNIMTPVTYYDKAGLPVTYDNVFVVQTDGAIVLKEGLPSTIYQSILKIEVEDTNAKGPKQKSTSEVLIYVQSKSDINPMFIESTWTPKNKIIDIDVDEENMKNKVIYKLKAIDPTNDENDVEFQTLKNNFSDTFNVDSNGEVTLLKRLDYENSDVKVFNISVGVVVLEDAPFDVNLLKTGERVVNLQQLPEVRFTDAILRVHLKNINDFAPVFQQDTYRKRVLENVKPSEVLLQVTAVDFDKDKIHYSISGESSTYFSINSTSGEVRLKTNVTLDREKQTIYKFLVSATDVPERGLARQSQANVWVEVLDVNDNAPTFARSSYSAVIPENVVPGTKIGTLKASDPDIGLAGEVGYSIVEEGDAVGLFSIDAESGVVRTNRVLTGRGRTDPYLLTVKAADKGEQALGT